MSRNQPAIERDLSYAHGELVDLEWRTTGDTGDGSYTLNGHAAVTGQLTTLYSGKYWTFREQISPGAFATVLAGRPDVHLNNGHDMTRAIARTGIVGVGGLELEEDDRGLRMFARLADDDPDVQALAAKMRRGIITQASFAFVVGRDEILTETDADGYETDTRTILEIADLIDVCVCARGAYPQTDASLRTFAQVLSRAGIDPAERLRRAGLDPAGLPPHRNPDGLGGTDVALHEGVTNEHVRRGRVAARIRAQVALAERPRT